MIRLRRKAIAIAAHRGMPSHHRQHAPIRVLSWVNDERRTATARRDRTAPHRSERTRSCGAFAAQPDLEAQKLAQIERYRWRAIRQASTADVAKLANSLRALSESRRKLFGLDAPAKAKPTGNLYTVLAASPDCPAWARPAHPFNGASAR